MKAAVLHQLGSVPEYEDFPDPIPTQEQLLITVKAASIKNLDKARASGKHYASYITLPAVAGIDGVGVLENGTRIYAQGITGMIAEKALIAKNRYTVLPQNIDDATAAALPNAAMGAALALRYRAEIKKGNVVLINGATGVTGQLAIQMAKYYGASKVIATGRNMEMLEKLTELGADEIISLRQDDEVFIEQLKKLNGSNPVDIVLDYLWGHPVELIITSLKGGGGINTFAQKVRIVSVGSMAGEDITLASGVLRSSAIELLGSGLGSFTQENMEKFRTEILPEMFQLAADKKLTIETESAKLENIEKAWQQEATPGKRMVVVI